MSDKSFICRGCGAEHDTVKMARDCFQSHEAAVKVPEPKAAELLGRAAAHMHDRSSVYDEPEGDRSMGKIVTAFNAITGRDLTESEGWMFMQQVKLVRLFTRSEYHADSAEDNIAYAALLAEAKGDGR
jgi:hypothetical protein